VHEDPVRSEFTFQSESFARTFAADPGGTLAALLEMTPAEAGSRWLDVACGPGIVARELARRVGSVLGIDLTEAMVERARADAEAAGIANAAFEVGDATALDLDDDCFDGALTRLSVHHIPVPGRVLAEMRRVVRAGGWVLVSDHVTDEDADAAAWHEQIERLRDPSHWACQTPARMRAEGEAAGLELDEERLLSIELDFDDWLARGSGGAASAALIDNLLERPPPGAESFRVLDGDGGRRLALRYWVGRWRVP
jgi:SAM-dependent methyltransferase